MKAYLENEPDAQVEIFKRFYIYSKKLVSELFQQFKNGARIEFDDMMSIALLTTFQLLKNYSYKPGFYFYWKTSVTFTLYKYFRENSLIENMEVRINSEDDYVGEFATSRDDPVSQVSADMLLEKIKKILLNPIYGFKMIEVEMYLLEVEKGYSIKDIAELYGLKYHAARLKNERTKARVKNILFNSKE